MAEREIDETSGIATTGHEWDGIKELDNPMPRWWLWTFYATIVFSIGYVIYYPAFPLLDAATPGISGQTNRSDLKAEMARVELARVDLVERINTSSLEEIRSNGELSRFAAAGGESAFKVYCSQCHGSGAQGGPGYPNLNDDDWLWGGDLESIYVSIRHGIRNDEDEDARASLMPAFGADQILGKDQIAQATQYVLEVSGQQFDPELSLPGRQVFLDNCASCHGEAATGDREIGAPNLADAISLYGHDAQKVSAQIEKPNHGVMPSWKTRLSDATIKQLTVYVHGLGGGERALAE